MNKQNFKNKSSAEEKKKSRQGAQHSTTGRSKGYVCLEPNQTAAYKTANIGPIYTHNSLRKFVFVFMTHNYRIMVYIYTAFSVFFCAFFNFVVVVAAAIKLLPKNSVHLEHFLV